MAEYEDDFAWAKDATASMTREDNPIIEILEHELLLAINNMDESLEDEAMEEQFRSVISRLQLEAYMTEYANGVRVTGGDEPARITARVTEDEATDLVKSLIATGEIPLTIRIISD